LRLGSDASGKLRLEVLLGARAVAKREVVAVVRVASPASRLAVAAEEAGRRRRLGRFELGGFDAPPRYGTNRRSTLPARARKPGRDPHAGPLYLSEGEAARLVVWLAHRQGRNPALAGDRPEIERLEHVARHWLTEDERVAMVRWMHFRAARGGSPVPDTPSAAGTAQGVIRRNRRVLRARADRTMERLPARAGTAIPSQTSPLGGARTALIGFVDRSADSDAVP
jgi:hypothetical protein